MSHPYRGAGRSGAKFKFGKILGTTKGAKHLNDDSVVTPSPVKRGIEDVKIMAKSPPKRLDRARGGKCGKTTVNVVVPPSPPGGPMMAPPLPPGPPPGPPPMAMAGPKPPMMPPPMPPRGPMPPAPGAGLPMPRARGGKVHSDEAADKKLIAKMIAADKSKKRDSGGQVDITEGKRRYLQGRVNKMDPLEGTVSRKNINPDWVPQMPEKKSGGYIGGTAKPNQLKQWAQYARKNSYQKKDGGGITKAKLTGGADSGVGRLQHSKAQRKHMKD